MSALVSRDWEETGRFVLALLRTVRREEPGLLSDLHGMALRRLRLRTPLPRFHVHTVMAEIPDTKNTLTLTVDEAVDELVRLLEENDQLQIRCAKYTLRIEELHYELECCRELLNERGIEGYLRRTRKEEPK